MQPKVVVIVSSAHALKGGKQVTRGAVWPRVQPRVSRWFKGQRLPVPMVYNQPLAPPVGGGGVVVIDGRVVVNVNKVVVLGNAILTTLQPPVEEG